MRSRSRRSSRARLAQCAGGGGGGGGSPRRGTHAPGIRRAARRAVQQHETALRRGCDDQGGDCGRPASVRKVTVVPDAGRSATGARRSHSACWSPRRATSLDPASPPGAGSGTSHHRGAPHSERGRHPRRSRQHHQARQQAGSRGGAGHRMMSPRRAREARLTPPVSGTGSTICVLATPAMAARRLSSARPAAGAEPYSDERCGCTDEPGTTGRRVKTASAGHGSRWRASASSCLLSEWVTSAASPTSDTQIATARPPVAIEPTSVGFPRGSSTTSEPSAASGLGEVERRRGPYGCCQPASRPIGRLPTRVTETRACAGLLRRAAAEKPNSALPSRAVTQTVRRWMRPRLHGRARRRRHCDDRFRRVTHSAFDVDHVETSAIARASCTRGLADLIEPAAVWRGRDSSAPGPTGIEPRNPWEPNPWPTAARRSKTATTPAPSTDRKA